MVKNPPSNTGDVCLIPGWGTKIPDATGQLTPCATTTELTCLNGRACVPQTTEPMRSGACTPHLERENPHATTREKPVRHNKETAHCNKRSHTLHLRPDAAKQTNKQTKYLRLSNIRKHLLNIGTLSTVLHSGSQRWNHPSSLAHMCPYSVSSLFETKHNSNNDT